MNLEALKSCVNNEKAGHSREKTTKSATNLIQNKPNFKNIKIGVSSFEKSKYEILPAGSSRKQTQFKPNTNPIYGVAEFTLSSFMTSKYVKSEDLAGNKTNPNKAKTNPIPSEAQVLSKVEGSSSFSSNVAAGKPFQLIPDSTISDY